MLRLTVNIILTLLFISTFVGCGKYDDGPAISLRSKAKRLEGTWKAVYQNQNGYEFLNDYTVTLSNSGGNKNPSGAYEAHTYFEDEVECYYYGNWELSESEGSIVVDYDSKPVRLRHRQWLGNDNFHF